MRDVIIAIVGVVAGVIAESVAYSFRRKADRMIELGDDLVEKLTDLDIAYRHCAESCEIEKLHNTCHRALVRVLRLRNGVHQRWANVRLLDKFTAIGKHHTAKTVKEDFFGNGETRFAEDRPATCQERSAMVIDFIHEIEHLNSHF